MQQRAIVLPLAVAAGLGGEVFGLAEMRLAHSQRPEPQQQAGNHDGVERPPPALGVAVHGGHIAAQHVAQGAADGDRHVEPRQHLPALGHGVEIGDDRRGHRSVGGLADAHQAARQQENDKGVGQPAGAAGQAPEPDADGDEPPSRPPLAEPAEQRRGDHVGDEEGRGEQAGHGAGMEIVLAGMEQVVADLRLDGRQDLAVDIVEQVHREQQQQRGPGPGDPHTRPAGCRLGSHRPAIVTFSRRPVNRPGTVPIFVRRKWDCPPAPPNTAIVHSMKTGPKRKRGRNDGRPWRPSLALRASVISAENGP